MEVEWCLKALTPKGYDGGGAKSLWVCLESLRVYGRNIAMPSYTPANTLCAKTTLKLWHENCPCYPCLWSIHKRSELPFFFWVTALNGNDLISNTVMCSQDPRWWIWIDCWHQYFIYSNVFPSHLSHAQAPLLSVCLLTLTGHEQVILAHKLIALIDQVRPYSLINLP